jgi:hypothetical protein
MSFCSWQTWLVLCSRVLATGAVGSSHWWCSSHAILATGIHGGQVHLAHRPCFRQTGQTSCFFVCASELTNGRFVCCSRAPFAGSPFGLSLQPSLLENHHHSLAPIRQVNFFWRRRDLTDTEHSYDSCVLDTSSSFLLYGTLDSKISAVRGGRGNVYIIRT